MKTRKKKEILGKDFGFYADRQYDGGQHDYVQFCGRH